jgi:hypothetical protein
MDRPYEPAMADGEDFNGKVIEEFRTNGGKVGGWFEGQTLLLLHHTGAKSGTDTINVRARVADPGQRATIYARQKEIASNFADYEKSAAPRQIPVILLEPVA